MALPRTPARRWLSPVPCGFTLLAAATSLTYSDDHAVNAWASTNLVNLGDHPVEALIASAFLFGADPWACLRNIALAGAMLAFLVIRFGNMRAVALIAAGQVLGTLVSEGLLAARIAAGQADPALRATLDVGPSYVIVSALAAVVAAGARQWHRWAALAALAVRAPHITSGLTTLAVTPVGHVTALTTGLLLAWGLRSSDARHRCLHTHATGAGSRQASPAFDAVVDEAVHRVDHRPATVALRASVPAGRARCRTGGRGSHTHEWTSGTRRL